MNILDFLNFGKENGIKADDLMNKTGLTRRLIRRAIEDEMINGTAFIGNMQDGSGYFIFDLPNEIDLAKRYCVRERARAFAILKRIRRLEGTIEKIEGNKYKGARLACGMTRKKALEHLGIDSSQLSKIESGKQEPTLDLLEKMFEIYGIF